MPTRCAPRAPRGSSITTRCGRAIPAARRAPGPSIFTHRRDQLTLKICALSINGTLSSHGAPRDTIPPASSRCRATRRRRPLPASRRRPRPVVVHHPVVDAFRGDSPKISTSRTCRARGRAPRLPPKTHSFKAWAEAVRLHAQSPGAQIEREYWRGVCATAAEPLAPRSPGLGRETIREALDPIATRSLLTSAHVDHGAEPVHLLLAGLAASLRDCFGRSRTLVTLEGHGRESSVADLDVTRTVGWFTCSIRSGLEPTVDAAAAGVGPGCRRCRRWRERPPGRLAPSSRRHASDAAVPRKGVGYWAPPLPRVIREQTWLPSPR